MLCVPGMGSGRRVMLHFISCEPIISSPSPQHYSSVSHHLFQNPFLVSFQFRLFTTQQPKWPFKNAVLIMPLHDLNSFFGFTLLLGECQNHYHDFLSILCMLWPQFTSATSSNITLSYALVFQSHLHCLVPWTYSPNWLPPRSPYSFIHAIALLIFCL